MFNVCVRLFERDVVFVKLFVPVQVLFDDSKEIGDGIVDTKPWTQAVVGILLLESLYDGIVWELIGGVVEVKLAVPAIIEFVPLARK